MTNEEGYYRLINLPPGTYKVTAELTGFAPFTREGILIRAGATFALDIGLSLGAIQETVTVAGDSPMVEVLKPGNVLNIDGDFQRAMPIQARRNWSDFLELTPGIISRGFDDGSGRQVYFGHATEHFAHVLQLEGMIASNYHDAQVTYVAMGTDMIADVQVKTGGVDASSPMGVGMVMNVITKSGGNIFSGSAGYAYQPYGWNGNNVANCSDVRDLQPERHRHADHREDQPVRRGNWRPDQERLVVVLRIDPSRGVGRRHQPHGSSKCSGSTLSSPAPSCSTTTAKAGSRT